jgi:hypothetical protein
MEILKKIYQLNGYSEFILAKMREVKVKVKQSHYSPGRGQKNPGG